LAGLPARDSPKLERLSCQKRVEEKDTLYHAQLDFYHLSFVHLYGSENQHIEMIREIPERFTGALSARSRREPMAKICSSLGAEVLNNLGSITWGRD
jgi:hypothetical protein